jgi:hypothetical protein
MLRLPLGPVHLLVLAAWPTVGHGLPPMCACGEQGCGSGGEVPSGRRKGNIGGDLALGMEHEEAETMAVVLGRGVLGG